MPFLLIGGGFFIYLIFHGITHLTDTLTQIVAPGEVELTLKAGDTYTVFLEEQSVVNGKIYSTSQSVQGLTCRVTSVQKGTSIGIRKASTNASYEVNGRSGHSVLEFVAPEDGKYLFACNYGPNSSGPEVVLAVGSGISAGISRTAFGSLAALFGGLGACSIVVLVVVARRQRYKNAIWQSGKLQF